MKVLPVLYWRLHKSLEKHGLDDASIARDFRINKRDVREAKKEIEEYKIEKAQEFWFGKNPFKNNGRELKKKEVK